MKSKLIIAVSVLITILSACSSKNEEVIMSDGHKVKGKIVASTESGIDIKLPDGQTQQISGDEIYFIYSADDSLKTDFYLDKFYNASPKNPFTLSQVSNDFYSYKGKKVKLQLIVINPSNYFNWETAGWAPLAWCAEATDKTYQGYLYFPKHLFDDRKDEILNFNNTKITAEVEFLSGSRLMMQVKSFTNGWGK